MTGHDLPPPSYDEAASSASAPSSAPPTAGQLRDIDSAEAVSLTAAPASTRPVPPAEAQRAQAPLSVIRSNESIKQDYIVNITENKAAPDVVLKTTNNSIKSSVYLQGNVPRAAEVTIETTNSSIATAFPDKDEGQAVVFNVRTTNSKIEVAFPTNFNGIVTAKTSNAKVNLSDSLRANSMLVPNAPEAPSALVTYRIKPKAANNSVGDSKGSADGGGEDQAMLDVCHIQTSNSNINLGYLNDVSKGLGGVSGKKDSGCVVS